MLLGLPPCESSDCHQYKYNVLIRVLVSDALEQILEFAFLLTNFSFRSALPRTYYYWWLFCISSNRWCDVDLFLLVLSQPDASTGIRFICVRTIGGINQRANCKFFSIQLEKPNKKQLLWLTSVGKPQIWNSPGRTRKGDFFRSCLS